MMIIFVQQKIIFEDKKGMKMMMMMVMKAKL